MNRAQNAQPKKVPQSLLNFILPSVSCLLMMLSYSLSCSHALLSSITGSLEPTGISFDIKYVLENVNNFALDHAESQKCERNINACR